MPVVLRLMAAQPVMRADPRVMLVVRRIMVDLLRVMPVAPRITAALLRTMAVRPPITAVLPQVMELPRVTLVAPRLVMEPQRAMAHPPAEVTRQAAERREPRPVTAVAEAAAARNKFSARSRGSGSLSAAAPEFRSPPLRSGFRVKFLESLHFPSGTPTVREVTQPERPIPHGFSGASIFSRFAGSSTRL
jgi:hypothetical protein